MKRVILPVLSFLFVTCVHAQTPNLLVGDEATKVSEHVWATMGFPNIGIVVGTRGVLVVDTGLGPQNGATAARVARKLAPTQRMYLTTTHFHPEHSSGEAGFPPGTTLIRDRVQQQEMDAHFREMVKMFAARSAQQRDLLSSVVMRRPDIVYDSLYRLDLGGGVTVRLLWFGAAHTKGDELIFIDPDKTLISGDVVQNKVVPNIYGEGGTPSSWIAVLDKIQPLGVLKVLPDHSAMGDGSLVADEKTFIMDLSTRALELKRQGTASEDAGKILTEEFKTKYKDWRINSLSSFVDRIYAE
jgi:glyoxylase-like metal-dependent hydrolase (beta-lactamase superfamily II)